MYDELVVSMHRGIKDAVQFRQCKGSRTCSETLVPSQGRMSIPTYSYSASMVVDKRV